MKRHNYDGHDVTYGEEALSQYQMQSMCRVRTSGAQLVVVRVTAGASEMAVTSRESLRCQQKSWSSMVAASMKDVAG